MNVHKHGGRTAERELAGEEERTKGKRGRLKKEEQRNELKERRRRKREK